VINSLGLGGAERALANFLGAIGEKRRSRTLVHVVLLDREPEKRELPSYVTKHVLDSKGSLPRSIVGLQRTLKRIRPDVAVSFLVRANVATAIAARTLGIPSILCERMHLSSHLEGRYRGLRLALAKALPRLGYRLATQVVGVSQGVSDDLVANFGADPGRTTTITNPFNLGEIEAHAKLAPEIRLPSRFIVAAGRLEPSKAMHVLVDAYLESGVEPDLVILGEGSLRGRLERQIATAAATGRIRLPGYVRNPFAVVGRAEAYVSASTNEGFPNAMVEAMALGVPVIATDCHSGPAEILAEVARLDCRDVTFAEHGILVPENDVLALAAALRSALGDPETQARYAEGARRRAQDFATEKTAEKLWTLIDSIAQSGRSSR
jgi:glycosyltransferase involved in cell wall biosynthesis